MNAAVQICIHTMHDDISSNVIMLRQFDQSVLPHKIKVPREDLGNTMNPALSREFHLFCEEEHPQRQANTDKNPYSVYGTLKRELVVELGKKARYAKRVCPVCAASFLVVLN